MLGKSVGVRRLGVVALCLAVTACAHNVNQDKATGEDGKPNGAVTLNFDNGEATTTGIVTYPGGDRVDWKVIEIPENQKAKLDFKLTWTPPRPGLQLQFDLFNEYWRPIGSSKKNSKRKRGKRSTSRLRTATLAEAEGKVYVRIYASERGDAGKYRLTVEYSQILPPIVIDPRSFAINDPPHLPDLAPPDFICTPQNFDMSKGECASVCPLVNPPPNWPGCASQCPPGAPDVENPACQKTMACPVPPDTRVARCRPIEKYWPACPDLGNPDMSNPRCIGQKFPPRLGRIVEKKIVGVQTIITIAVGSDRNVTDKWSCAILQGKDPPVTGTPLSGGGCTIISVDKKTTKASTTVTPDQLSSNNTARLSPP